MIQKPKGTRDFLPETTEKIRKLENLFIEICGLYGYREIRFPMFEKTSLFQRSVGESSDIVRKEMFRVISGANLDKYARGDYDIEKEGFTLRPEGTAPTIRSFIENKLYAQAQPTKLFYMGSNFRNERPQAGRFREFTQFGIEYIGSQDGYCDAEVIALAMDVIKKVGIDNTEVRINSVGCPKCRSSYHELLKDFLADKVEFLCYDCKDRYEINPLRILDCKVEADQERIKGHPVLLDHLCDECSQHFEDVKGHLNALGIEYVVDPSIVRGLDYYTKTAFEIISPSLGSQSTICGGGRYDGLTEELEGPATPSVGFGMGMDRLLMAMAEDDKEEGRKGILLLALGQEQKMELSALSAKLRRAGLYCQLEVMERSLKAAMKYADKQNFKSVLVYGQDESEKGVIVHRDLDKGEQKEIKFTDIVEVLSE
ncbi:MAG: histidine--tRNA ligase [Tissierellia bacterium]|nr:histidine--tRNA ligase [Tissierellia bacterium]